VVRLAAPPLVAWEFAAPFAGWLKHKQPGLQLDVMCAIQYLDLARGEADLALRQRPAPPGGDLTTVCELRHRNVAVASKEYAAKLPRKYSWGDLGWIAWSPPYDQVPPNPQLEQLVPGFQPVFTSDNPIVQRQAAEAGVGATVIGDVRHRFSRRTGLVPLKQLDLGPWTYSSLYLVCAKSALDIPRVRIVADLLVDELRRAET
jgi:DNA-binding transcriptional LysR family regulator